MEWCCVKSVGRKGRYQVREVKSNLWKYPADAYVITTNGNITKMGNAVMGRGVALQAKMKFKGIEKKLGGFIRLMGNHVQVVMSQPHIIVSFPVKHWWMSNASLELIDRSAKELVILTNREKWKIVAMPRPGCGNGRRTWVEVEPILKRNHLDDRFVVVNI